jgi:hypothetical protein
LAVDQPPKSAAVTPNANYCRGRYYLSSQGVPGTPTTSFGTHFIFNSLSMKLLIMIILKLFYVEYTYYNANERPWYKACKADPTNPMWTGVGASASGTVTITYCVQMKNLLSDFLGTVGHDIVTDDLNLLEAIAPSLRRDYTVYVYEKTSGSSPTVDTNSFLANSVGEPLAVGTTIKKVSAALSPIIR